VNIKLGLNAGRQEQLEDGGGSGGGAAGWAWEVEEDAKMVSFYYLETIFLPPRLWRVYVLVCLLDSVVCICVCIKLLLGPVHDEEAGAGAAAYCAGWRTRAAKIDTRWVSAHTCLVSAR
jgi:hypothetical protein